MEAKQDGAAVPSSGVAWRSRELTLLALLGHSLKRESGWRRPWGKAAPSSPKGLQERRSSSYNWDQPVETRACSPSQSADTRGVPSRCPIRGFPLYLPPMPCSHICSSTDKDRMHWIPGKRGTCGQRDQDHLCWAVCSSSLSSALWPVPSP